MNKSDLTAAVATTSGLSKTDAEKAIDATFAEIQKALTTGDDVRLIGFGNFSVSHRAATTGRNPRTGQPIEIAASKQPKFSAGKALKDALNA